jgi:hypothetical protein
MGRRLVLLLAAATALATAGMGGAAQIQIQDADGLADRPDTMVTLRITDEQVDRIVFGTQRDAATARRLLDSRLKSRIEYIQRLYGLTAQERARLHLAGRGDIKRFFDRVEDARGRAQLAAQDRIGFERTIRELHALSQHYESGIFDDESLSAKALTRILKEKQLTQDGKDRWRKVLTLHQARVEWVVSSLQKSLLLSDQQRQRLLTRLLEETRPPRTFGPLDYFGIVYQASELPEAILRPIFDDAQWRNLAREFENARRLEAMLKDNGYLPEARQAGTRPAEPRDGAGSDRAEEADRGNADDDAEQPRLN